MTKEQAQWLKGENLDGYAMYVESGQMSFEELLEVFKGEWVEFEWD